MQKIPLRLGLALVAAAGIAVAVWYWWPRPLAAPVVQWAAADAVTVHAAEPTVMLAFRIGVDAAGERRCAPVRLDPAAPPPMRWTLVRSLPAGTTRVPLHDVGERTLVAGSRLSTIFVEASDAAGRRRLDGLAEAMARACRLIEARDGEWLSEAEFRASFAAGRGGSAPAGSLTASFATGEWRAAGLAGLVLDANPFAGTPTAAARLRTEAAVLPTGLEVRVDGAMAGRVVALVLGLEQTSVPLPGGAVLGVRPDLIAAITLVDDEGLASLVVPWSTFALAGLEFFGQVAAIDLRLPLADPAAIALSAVESLRAPRPGEAADVYVLFGQSNAEGYAEAAGLPPELRGPRPRCRVWNAASAAFEPLTAGRNGRTLTPLTWCGPELSLGQCLTQEGRVVYLVKFAVGGTALGPTPGPWNEWGVDAAELYAVLQQWLTAALADLRGQGLVPGVRGICMMQGESDATDAAWAEAYAARLAALVQRFRADLVAGGAASAVPFVIGMIHKELPPADFPWVEPVRQAQQSVAATAPRCATVDTGVLTLCDDGIHFDTSGVILLGGEFAAALHRLGF